MQHDTVHHFHKRKRIHEKHEKYPHPDKLKRFVDKAIYPVALFSPIMTIPQIWKIWVEQNASGVSALSWSAYFFVTIFWVVYGVLHKEKPIIITNCAWLGLEVLIVVGTLMYG